MDRFLLCICMPHHNTGCNLNDSCSEKFAKAAILEGRTYNIVYDYARIVMGVDTIKVVICNCNPSLQMLYCCLTFLLYPNVQSDKQDF